MVCVWCAHGVRVVCAWCACGGQVHLRRAAHCDLFVDSRLCNAHTSATDALWAGTPQHAAPSAAPHNIGLQPLAHTAAASTHGHGHVVAGTPLISLPGDPQPARVALSLLLAVGLPSLVVHSLRGYEEQVVHLTAAAGGGHRGGAHQGPRGFLLGSTGRAH